MQRRSRTVEWMVWVCIVAVSASASSARTLSEGECLAKLQQPNLPYAELVATLRELSPVATTASVTVLEPWLTDPQWSHMALYALGTVSGPAVNEALLRALDRSTGTVRAGLIEALGQRRVADAVPKLVAFLSNPETEPECFQAAALALGRIGGAQAASALWNVYERTQGGVRTAVTEGLLRCIQGAAEAGSLETARAWARRLEATRPPTHVASALVRWFLRHGEPTDLERWRARLLSGNPEDVHCILSAVADDAGPIAGWLATDTEHTALRRRFASALTRVGNATAHSQLKKLLGDPDPEVRAIALQGLARWGDPAALAACEGAESDSSAEVRTAARESLAGFPGSAADEWLITRARTEAPPQFRAWIVELLGQRATTQAVPVLIACVADPALEVRRAAWSALKSCATEAHLDLLLNAAPREEGEDLRAFESALMAVLGRISASDGDEVAQRIQARWNGAPAVVRPILLRAWRRLGSAAALRALVNIADQDATHRIMAGRLLCEWPSPDAFPWLWKAATEHSDPALRRAALYAVLRWIPDLPEELSQKLNRLEKLADRLESREDRLKWVAAASRIASPKTLELILARLDSLADVSDEVASAVADLVETLGQGSPDVARRAAELAAARCADEAVRRRLHRWLRRS